MAATAARSTASSAATATVPTALAAPTALADHTRRGGWLPMPDDPTHPYGLSGEARFRADLVAYLDTLFIGVYRRAGGAPEATRVALMHELSERGPAWARLPDIWPQSPRRTLRQVVADRRDARRPLPPEVVQRWRAESARVADQLAERRRAGAVAERRLAEALRAWAIDRNAAGDHQHRVDPPARPADRPRRWFDEDRDSGRDAR